MRGSPDLIIMNRHKFYNGYCIEFKNPNKNYKISDSQLVMRNNYRNMGYKFLISCDYDEIITSLVKYFENVRLPCRRCNLKQEFKSMKSLDKHNKYFHKM